MWAANHPTEGAVLSYQRESRLTELIEEQRLDARRFGVSLGPLIEAAAVIRTTCQTLRVLLDEMEVTVGVHLELLDSLLRSRDGSRWWQHIEEEPPNSEYSS